MNITVKCPNCYQQVSNDNRFCIFCGYDLSGTESVPEDDLPTPELSDPVNSDPVFFDGPRFCPKGHDVPDPSLGFCSTCGSPLVDKPSESEETEREEEPPTSEEPVARMSKPDTIISRKCKCGYVCDDPALSFCPACGIPLDATESVDDSGWVCVCGQLNPSDMLFCSECGKPKDWKPATYEPSVEHEGIDVPIGMKPPTDSDLDKKATYDP